VLRGARLESTAAEHQLVRLDTGRGRVEGRYFGADTAAAPAGRRGVLWLGGASREWVTPARGLYQRLAAALAREGVVSLWLRYRDASRLAEATHDALAGLRYLADVGAGVTAVAGHSFGGAIAIRAAAADPRVRTVVGLATQSAGAAPAADLGPRCSLLLLHGEADRVVLPINAAEVYQMAREPKRLVRFPRTGHNLNESADEVYQTILAWFQEQLDPGGAGPAS
jgi:dipeptidyl aminopeptidase/acylaminoacyl peptidase